MTKLFHKLPENFITVFSGYNLFFHVLAVISTFVLVSFGFDWFYFTHSQILILKVLLFPAIIIGGLLPILFPVTLYVIGRMRKMQKIIITSFALGQSAILGSVISSLYKLFTGRIQPDLLNTIMDISHDFQFGIGKHGIFWGWPSSHTTIAFAMAFCLIILYSKNKKICYGSLIYAFYIGLGVSISIHWFSEFIAGALIGSVIGIVVGKSFRHIQEKSLFLSEIS